MIDPAVKEDRAEGETPRPNPLQRLVAGIDRLPGWVVWTVVISLLLVSGQKRLHLRYMNTYLLLLAGTSGALVYLFTRPPRQ